MAIAIIDRYVPSLRNDFGLMLILVLFVLRSFAVFGYGFFRLQRGKHAPYAEILWSLVTCSFVAAVMWQLYRELRDIGFHVLAIYVILSFSILATAAVVFVRQRRQPPAWKWKTGYGPGTDWR